MTCNTSAVAACRASASSRSASASLHSALHSASCRCRSAISCSGSANVLSGVALICGPRRDRCPRDGSYRDRYEPPRVVDQEDQRSAGEPLPWPAPSVPFVGQLAGYCRERLTGQASHKSFLKRGG